MENSQSRNWKKKWIINTYYNEHITELNKLICAGGKLVSDKIGVPLKNTNWHSKPGYEIRLETQIRNLQQAKMIRKRENAGTSWNEKKTYVQKVKQTIQLKKITQKVLLRGGRLIRYRDSIKQYREKRHSKTTKGNPTSKLGENVRRHTSNQCVESKRILEQNMRMGSPSYYNKNVARIISRKKNYKNS